MASIFKRGKNKNNRKAPWLIQYTDHNGKRPCVTGFPDKALTEQLAAKLEGEVRLRRKGLIDPKEEAAIERKALTLPLFRYSSLRPVDAATSSSLV